MNSSTTTKLPNGKIPIIHKEIQPIIHEEIQPVITTEVQPVICKYIQPVIFPEKLSIEEVIQQLQQLKQSHNDNSSILRFGEPTNGKDEYQQFIQKIEQHITNRKVVPKTENVVQNSIRYEFVPYIQYSNGNIVPYVNNSINSINNNTQMMETIIAVNFRSISDNINLFIKINIIKNEFINNYYIAKRKNSNYSQRNTTYYSSRNSTCYYQANSASN